MNNTIVNIQPGTILLRNHRVTHIFIGFFKPYFTIKARVLVINHTIGKEKALEFTIKDFKNLYQGGN